MSRTNMVLRRPIILFFILSNAFFVAGKNILAKWGIDQTVVIVGNLILFAVYLVSLFLFRKSMNAGNPNVFVRAMYSNFMIKLFVCIIAVFIYLSVAKPNVNKPGLFVCMGLYVVYTVIEVSTLTKLLREKKNA